MECPIELNSWMRVAGDVLTGVGLVATSAVPFGLGLMATGYVQEGVYIVTPLILATALAALFIKKQKAGLKRGGVGTWAVARLTLWPTVSWNYVRHLIGERNYYDEVYPGVFVGGAPWALMAEEFIQTHGVKTVVNCCEEYKGPESVYRANGVQQLRLNCIDFCDVPLDRIVRSVEFLNSENRLPVYIHCKAGKGRAVTVATAYLAKHFHGDTELANKAVKDARPTAIGTVFRRPAMQEFKDNYCKSPQGAASGSEFGKSR